MADWEEIDVQSGNFGRYVVRGNKHRNRCGAVGWHILSYPEAGEPMHDFWVSGFEFHSFSIQYSYNLTNENRFQIDGVVEPVDPDEKVAILEALASWEPAVSQSVTR